MAFDLRAVLRLDDKMTAPLKRVQRQLTEVKKATDTYTGATGRLRDANVRFTSGAGRTTSAISAISTASKRAGSGFDSLAGKGTRAFKMLAGGLGVAGVGAAAFAGIASVGKAMDFEAQLSSIQALTGATGAEMAKMQTLALKMGANTKYNALQAAQGIEELLKAGITPAAVQSGALQAALNLATAGGLELAEAAEIMSTALNAYKKDGMSAAQASNILAGTANASATDVHDLRYALASVSAVAAGVGLSFSDTNIALGLFANNGLKGSDAGTSLKTMLQNLQPTTDTQTALFRALGLVTKSGSNAFYDAAGNIKSLESIANVLHGSLAKLTNQQRSLALETLFGTDAVRAGNILYSEGSAGVKKFLREMSKVTALDVARKKMDNAAGAVEQFKGAIETLQISALLPTMPIIKNFANAAADFVEKYTPQITAGMKRMVDKSRKYMSDHFTKNPEFMKLTTPEAKIHFVFADLVNTFNKWYGSGGSAQIANVASTLIKFLSNMVEANAPLIVAAGTSIGAKLSAAILKGATDGLMNSKLGAILRKYTPAGWAYDGLNGLYGALGITGDQPKPYTNLPTVPYGTIPKNPLKDLKPPVAESGPRRGPAAVPTSVNGGPRIKQEGKPAATVHINGPINIHTEADYQSFVGRLAQDLAR